MRIASIIDVSLVDVPGIPVTVIFTAGCNFDCPYCQNADIIPRNSGIELPIEDIVTRATGHLVDGYCITGGEPTIHKDLPDLLGALSDTGDCHINLNTQGSIPRILKDCIPYLDSVWFDLKASPSRYREICRTKDSSWPKVASSMEMLLNSSVDVWPRTTYAKGLLFPEDIVDILEFLKNVGFEGHYLIQDYVPSSGVRESEASRLQKPDENDLVEIRNQAPEGIMVDIEFRRSTDQ